MSGPTRAVGDSSSKPDGEISRNLTKAGESSSAPLSAELSEVSGDVGNELNETVVSQADGDVDGQSGSEDGSRRRTPFTENSQLEADLALARAIQEQECAFMMLYHQQALAAASASASGSRSGSRGSSRRLQGRQDREVRQTGSSVDNPIVLLSEGEELEANDPDAEEEFADADDDEYGEWEEASEDDGETGEDGEMGEVGERGSEAADEPGRESRGQVRSASLQRQLFQNGGSEVDQLGLEPETAANMSGVLRDGRGDGAEGAGEGAEGIAAGGVAEGGEAGEAGHGGEGAYEDDEAFARALQEEEEREMARRLFAMAGLQLSDGRGSSSRRRAEMLAAAHGVAWPFGEGGGDEESEEEDSEEEDGEDEDALDVDEMTYEVRVPVSS
ncbi:unnamed protein product [Closterium sp. NIES-54]